MQQENADSAIFFNVFPAFGPPPKAASKEYLVPKYLNGCV